MFYHLFVSIHSTAAMKPAPNHISSSPSAVHPFVAISTGITIGLLLVLLLLLLGVKFRSSRRRRMGNDGSDNPAQSSKFEGDMSSPKYDECVIEQTKTPLEDEGIDKRHRGNKIENNEYTAENIKKKLARRNFSGNQVENTEDFSSRNYSNQSFEDSPLQCGTAMVTTSEYMPVSLSKKGNLIFINFKYK